MSIKSTRIIEGNKYAVHCIWIVAEGENIKMIGKCIKSTAAVKKGREKRREEKWEEEGVAVIPSSSFSSSCFSVESNLWAEKKRKRSAKVGKWWCLLEQKGGGRYKREERGYNCLQGQARKGVCS